MLSLLAVFLLAPPSDPQFELVQAVNQVRVENGVLPVKIDPSLGQCAQGYAKELADTGRFSHEGESGSSPMSRAVDAGYQGLVAENLGIGYATAAEAVAGWMSSAGHRQNLLNPAYRFVGAGNDTHRRGQVWVLNLGQSHLAYPVILELDAPNTDKTSIRVDVSADGLAREMRIGIDGKSESAWRQFQPTFQLDLPGTGLHEVTVELRGAAGWNHTTRSRIISRPKR